MSLREACAGIERRRRRGNRKEAGRLLSEPLIRVIMLIPLMPKKMSLREASDGFARWGRRGNRKEAWLQLSESEFSGFKNFQNSVHFLILKILILTVGVSQRPRCTFIRHRP